MHIPNGVFKLWKGHPFEGGQFIGTAFLIARDIGLTALHVIDTSENGDDLFALATWMGAFVIKIPQENIIRPAGKADVCAFLIKREVRAPESLVLSTETSDSSDGYDEIVIYGFADAHTPLEPRNFVRQGYDDTCGALIYSSFPARGMSGAPGYGLLGNFKGIAWARNADQNRTYLTPADTIHRFLSEAGLSVGKAAAHQIEIRLPGSKTVLLPSDRANVVGELAPLLNMLADSAASVKEVLVSANELVSKAFGEGTRSYDPTWAYTYSGAGDRWSTILDRPDNLTDVDVIALYLAAARLFPNPEMISRFKAAVINVMGPQ